MVNSYSKEQLKAIKRAAQDEIRKRFLNYKPYDKQKEFHNLGATKRERVLSAGNQLGKSEAGAAEMAMHLTGIYPDW